jgi:cell division protein FtsZ
LGGGTGTGAGPVIGELVSGIGAISVGVVTRPFVFEGIKKAEAADAGIKELRKICDTLITIPNEKLFARTETNSFLLDAFDTANGIIFEAVKAICSLVKFPGLINIDFANVREVLRKSGDACFGVGVADGKERAKKAAGLALNSPLLQNTDISSGKNILVSVTGGENIRREELDCISETLSARLGETPNVVMGAAIDKKLGGKVSVTVIVTGLAITADKKTPGVSGDTLSHFISGQAVHPGHVEDELDIPTFLRKKRRGTQEG